MKRIIKINLKTKYDLSFLLKPFALLSVLSVFTYLLKILSEFNTDKIFLSIILLIIIPLLLNKINSAYKKIIIMLILLIGIVLYINIYDKIVFFLAEKCRTNGVAFGALNLLFNTFSLNDFENLIYHTSYGGARIINEFIRTGAIDIYLADENCAESYTFLCGKMLSLFCALGLSFSINKNKKEVLIITVLAIFTGNTTIFLLMLLTVFTPYYFLFYVFNFLSYLIANLAMINAGFYFNGSLFELIFCQNNTVYILAIGILICAISYYISRLVSDRLIC